MAVLVSVVTYYLAGHPTSTLNHDNVANPLTFHLVSIVSQGNAPDIASTFNKVQVSNSSLLPATLCLAPLHSQESLWSPKNQSRSLLV